MPTPVIIDLPGPIASVELAPAPGSTPPAPPPPPVEYSTSVKQAQARLDQERETLAQARAALEAAVRKVQTLEADLTAAAEAQLVDLALAIAEKVLVQEIDQGRARIEPLVREALRHMPARRDLVVRLNPQDLAQALASAAAQQGATVQGATGGLSASAASAAQGATDGLPTSADAATPILSGLKTVADASLRRGECLVESAEGTVPALLADRLQAVAGMMKNGVI